MVERIGDTEETLRYLLPCLARVPLRAANGGGGNQSRVAQVVSLTVGRLNECSGLLPGMEGSAGLGWADWTEASQQQSRAVNCCTKRMCRANAVVQDATSVTMS